MQLREASGGDGEVPGGRRPGQVQPHVQLRDQRRRMGRGAHVLRRRGLREFGLSVFGGRGRGREGCVLGASFLVVQETRPGVGVRGTRLRLARGSPREGRAVVAPPHIAVRRGLGRPLPHAPEVRIVILFSLGKYTLRLRLIYCK